MKEKTKIKLTESQEELLMQNANVLYDFYSETEYMFLPYWFEKDKDGSYFMHLLGDLPQELKQRIRYERDKNKT